MTTEQPTVSENPTGSITLPLVRAAAVLAMLSILWQGYSASNVIVAPAGGTPRRVLELAAFDKQATVIDDLEAAVTVVQAVGGSPG